VEQFILKERIAEQIGGRKVKAALFYSFNFDPKFFENYVMPLFVPGKDFTDEAIHNKITWRTCIKQNLVPPITVFCDFFAKSNTEAPTLGYKIFCVKVPGTSGKTMNFHPKDIFILTEDENGDESLILITGSGNITPSGWCDNHECFSIRELPTKRSPNISATNIYQDTIGAVQRLAGLSDFTMAEALIYLHLRYVEEENESYFSSLAESFKERLERDIFNLEPIHSVEIISPYFSNNTALVQYLKEKGVQQIMCLLPALRTNEIMMEEETFLSYKEAGVQWSIWRDSELAEAVRNNHAKIYRFYGTATVYTIVGSVNFTQPAWKPYKKDRNEANIESAVVYRSRDQKKWLQSKNIDMESFRFCVNDSLEHTTMYYAGRNPPELDFFINWKTKLLTCKGKKLGSDCSFTSLFEGRLINNGEQLLPMSETDIKLLSKNTLIEIKEVKNGLEMIHYYYAQQSFIEHRPLGIQLDAATILKYWANLDDEFAKESLTRLWAEAITDASGVEHEDRVVKKLLLNEMASHFNGLVRLENKLFKKIKNKGERTEHLQVLKYYLLSENIDTISFYFSELQSQVAKNAIQKSFYWMVIQILVKSFYEKAASWEYKADIDKLIWKSFIKEVNQKKAELSALAHDTAREIPGLEKKQHWVINQLAATYD
jgi:hypothetical protein